MKELKIWWLYTNYSLQILLSSRTTAIVLLVGKFVRVLMFLFFLSVLLNGVKNIAGYSREQIIFFYLSFNIIDTLAQLFFREVYRFRPLIVSGNFDFVLLKPVNPLVRVLTGGTDFLDLAMLVILSIITSVFVINNIPTNFLNVFLYLLLLLNGLIIAAAFHIFVLGIGIMTTSVDHLISIYRDLTSMLKIPVDLYIEPMRSFLTFVIPVGIMVTFPAKAFLGMLDFQPVIISFLVGIISLNVSLWFWKYAVKQYASASS